jgi:predicted nuclease of predicted toxin-antitoxin system
VKLLFDANISYRLAISLSDLYPGSAHVRLVGLERATDREVWDYARTNDFSIVSKDSDFHHLSFLHGSPPKVIWIRLGNCRTSEIEKVLKAQHESLVYFRDDEESSFLLLG